MTSNHNPITLADVARQAGVSLKTVSRVVNNEALVASVTRQKVQLAIDQLGFVPNIWAQRLARGASGLITLLVGDGTPAYMIEVIRGVMDCGEKLGYHVSLHRLNCTDDSQVEKLLSLTAQRQAEGLIFTPPCDNSLRLLQGLRELRFPFIRLTPHERNKIAPWVAASDEQGSYEAARHLLSLGHKNIAYLQGPPTHQVSWARLSGLRRALIEAGVEEDPQNYLQGDWTFGSGLRLARQLLRLPRRPTAILAGNDDMAAGILQAAWELGLRCPGQISVTGFDDVPLAAELSPPLTTVIQPIYEIAYTASTILIEQLIQGKPGNTCVEVPTRLMIRESTAVPDPLSRS